MTPSSPEGSTERELPQHENESPVEGQFRTVCCSVILPFMILMGLSLLFFGWYAGAMFAVMVIVFCIVSKTNTRRRTEEEEEEYRRQLERQHNGIRPPVEPRNLEVLIVQKYEPPEGGVTSDGALCEICLDEFQAGDLLASSPNTFCIHKFHKDCITPALLVNPTCPCCRRDYLKLTAEDEEEKPAIVNDIEHQFGTSPNSVPFREMENPAVAVAFAVEDQNIVTARTPVEDDEREIFVDGDVLVVDDNDVDPNDSCFHA
jgi:hypothetical protein